MELRKNVCILCVTFVHDVGKLKAMNPTYYKLYLPQGENLSGAQ